MNANLTGHVFTKPITLPEYEKAKAKRDHKARVTSAASLRTQPTRVG